MPEIKVEKVDGRSLVIYVYSLITEYKDKRSHIVKCKCYLNVRLGLFNLFLEVNYSFLYLRSG